MNCKRQGPVTETEIHNFEKKIIPLESGCWYWTGSKASPDAGNHDYPRFGYRGHTLWAHRFAYELWVGPIPDGMQIDHLCKTRPCANPRHLEAVTGAENCRRTMKTQCKWGHPYDAANTRMYRGYKRCKHCDRNQHSARKAARLAIA